MNQVARKLSSKARCAAFAAVASFFALSGCLGGGGSLTNLPANEATLLNLHIRLGKVDASAPANSGVLGKAANTLTNDEQIILKNMTLRFTSNLKDTVWDVVDMISDTSLGVGGFPTGEISGDRSVWVDVSLPPLRWWAIEIKTYDMRDSVIHQGTVTGVSSKGGQTVNITVPLLNSRFSLYEARYVLPGEIYAAGVPEEQRVYQKVFFSRLVLAVDGKVVRDSSSFSPSITSAGTRFITAGDALRGAAGRFFFRPGAAGSDTITHLQTYQYVETGLRSFDISAYGYLEGDTLGMEPRLLFQGSATLNIAAGENIQSTPVVLAWKGPGSSPNDSTVTPGHPDWTGVGMNVLIGKTGKVTQTIDIPGGLNL